jgi:hypothetical protein
LTDGGSEASPFAIIANQAGAKELGVSIRLPLRVMGRFHARKLMAFVALARVMARSHATGRSRATEAAGDLDCAEATEEDQRVEFRASELIREALQVAPFVDAEDRSVAGILYFPSRPAKAIHRVMACYFHFSAQRRRGHAQSNAKSVTPIARPACTQARATDVHIVRLKCALAPMSLRRRFDLMAPRRPMSQPEPGASRQALRSYV